MRRFRRSGRRGSRRKTSWHYGFGASAEGGQQIFTSKLLSHWVIWPIGTLDPSLQTFEEPVVTNPLDLTLVRSISQFSVWIQDPNSGSGDGDFMAVIGYGLIKFSYADPNLVDSIELDSGESVPGPLTSPGMDWIYRSAQAARSFGSVSQTIYLGNDFQLMQSRAMRKLSQNEGVLQVLEFVMPGSTLTDSRDLSWFYESRCLVKEP